MPLKLDFKSGEKMVINGAVIENVGANAKIVVHNLATILREKEVLTEKECGTPASRVYFALQCAYMFPEKKDQYIKTFEKCLEDYVAACPSATDISDKIRGHVAEGEFYKGLKASQKLIAHEVNVLNTFNAGMERLLDSDEE